MNYKKIGRKRKYTNDTEKKRLFAQKKSKEWKIMANVNKYLTENEIQRLNTIVDERIADLSDSTEIISIIENILAENNYKILTKYEIDLNYSIPVIVEHSSGLRLNCWLYSLEGDENVGFDNQLDLHDPNSKNYFFGE